MAPELASDIDDMPEYFFNRLAGVGVIVPSVSVAELFSEEVISKGTEPSSESGSYSKAKEFVSKF